MREANISIINKISNPSFINKYIPGTILIAKADPEFTILEANDEFFKLLGYTKEEIRDTFQNKGFHTLHPDDRTLAAEILLSQAQNNPDGRFNVVCRTVNKQCGYKTINFCGCMVPSSNGEMICYFLLTDISEHINTAKQLDEERDFNDVLSSLDDNTFFDYNISKSIMKSSKAFADRLGIPTTIKNYPYSIRNMRIITQESLERFIKRCRNPETSMFEEEYQFITIDGINLWFRCKCKVIKDSNNMPIRVIGKMIDITTQRLTINTLEQLANKDELTGLNNSHATRSYISNYLSLSENLNEYHALLIIDLDNFKQINDTFGHPYGDYVLKNTASSLIETFRKEDIIGRIGGDEFLVLMKRYRTIEDVYTKTKELCERLNQSYTQGDISVTTTASIGVALFPIQGSNLATLYEYADIALYHVKYSGKNGYCFYNNQKRPICEIQRTEID